MTRVLFLQQQPCIRTLKYAAGLRSALDGVTLGFAYQGKTLSQWYGTGDDLFDQWWDLGSVDLREVIRAFQPDLIHSHNLPDRLTVSALDLTGGDTPVVHDVHDLQSLRQTPYEDGFPEPSEPLALEEAAIVGSAAVVTVSEELVAEIDARYEVPRSLLVFPNYALARDLPATLAPVPARADGPFRLVYQGTLSTNGGHYDLREIFVAIAANGVCLDVYPSRPAPDYEALAADTPGLRCLPTLEPRSLLRALPAYDFGWAGFNATLNARHLDTALPNKLFEYIGCGLPVLTTGHKAIARFVTERGVGVDLPGLDSLADRLAALDMASLRAQVAATRMEHTVEANMQPVVDLYKTLSGT